MCNTYCSFSHTLQHSIPEPHHQSSAPELRIPYPAILHPANLTTRPPQAMPPTPSAALLRHSATALLRRRPLPLPHHALRLPRALSSPFHSSAVPRLAVPAAKNHVQRPIVVNLPLGEEKEM